MVRLNEELRAALHTQGTPIRVTDPQTNRIYVLVPADEYDRIHALADAIAIDPRDAYAAQERVAAASGWDDPLMNEYDDYDSHRKAG